MLSVSSCLRSFHISILAPGEILDCGGINDFLWKIVKRGWSYTKLQKGSCDTFLQEEKCGEKTQRTFISVHKHLEDKMMNMWYQVVVSNLEALAVVSADVQCRTYQERSTSQNDWVVTEETCTLWAVTVSAHKRGLLVWEATLCWSPNLQGWGTYWTTLQPPSNQDPALPLDGGRHGDAGKKSWGYDG